jgi:hypothetical protein
LEIEGMRKRDCGMVKDKQKDSIHGTRLGGWGQSVLGSEGEVKKVQA